MKRTVLAVIFFHCLVIMAAAGLGPQYVTDRASKHNLSSLSTGTSKIKALSETQICIFCHTPHNASPQAPLWNHDITAVTTYIHYWSPTMNAYSSAASAPEIDGYSRLCLSCHDGTVALGAVRNKTANIAMQVVAGKVDASGKIIGGPGFVGTDLSGSHPTSFVFDAALAAADGNLNWPLTDSDVKLYPTGSGMGLQCTSCHDPHDDSRANDPANPTLRFWRKTTYDDVCLVCHK